MSDRVNLQDFLAGFLLEAEEHLHSVNRNLVATSEALRNTLPEPRAVRELFRSLHTIKGLSSMVGAEPIVDISHEMEGLLRIADQNGGRLSEKALDLILQGTRAIEERVRGIKQNGVKNIPPAPAALIEALAMAQTGIKAAPTAEKPSNLPPEIAKNLSASDLEQISQATKAGKRAVMVDFQPSPANVANGINITSVRARLGGMGDLIKVLPRSSPSAPTGIAFGILMITSHSDLDLATAVGGNNESVLTVNSSSPAARPAPPSTPDLTFDILPADQSSIRVDIRRLDETLEQLSSLFVTRFKLERATNDLAAKGVDTRDLRSVLAENSRQLRRLRSAISSARMVPLADLLQRLPLVVRGITKDSDKSVNVNIQAGSAEVDKSVADKIFPAIVHLVRNAVDHALETKTERKNAGKPEAGELTIVCDDSSGTNLVLTISDDGRGINREAVARQAGKTAASTDEELLEQICTAGLSTSAGVTLTSGRGMGMEIVKRTVELLGGTLTLHTTIHKGTVFTIRVPVTVTIVDVLSFVSGAQTYVVPMALIDEIVEVEAGLSVRAPAPDRRGNQPFLIQYRGQTIPLFSLDAILRQVPGEKVSAKALIVSNNKRTVAFGVDRMIGQQEAVVRPLDDSLVKIAGMAGATDLGDGRPTLVLDLGGLGAALARELVEA